MFLLKLGAPVLRNNLFILLASCPSLDSPSNGMIDCSLGDNLVPSYEDTCSFTCDTGYVLTGSDTRTCQSDGSWNGSTTMCEISELLLMYVYTIRCAQATVVVIRSDLP